jgi:hypothetical protein
VTDTVGRFDFKLDGTSEDAGDAALNIPIPTIHLRLRSWTTSSDGTPQITAGMMHPDEIDANIEVLKADLDAVGRRAKAYLQHAIETKGGKK